MPIIVGFMHNMIAHVMGDVYAKKSTFCVRCRAVLMLISKLVERIAEMVCTDDVVMLNRIVELYCIYIALIW
jgi:hypothetical protein